MKAGETTGCGRMALYSLLKILLGTEKALPDWLDRTGDSKVLLSEWRGVPIAKTEFHRQVCC